MYASANKASSMSAKRQPPFREYWDWFSVAVFILITLDMMTTRYAASVSGTSAEVNPFMQWVLGQNLVTLVAVNLIGALIAIASFYVLLMLLESSRAPYDRYLTWGIELWLGALISVGLFVFANNLAFIIHGRSLLWFG